MDAGAVGQPENGLIMLLSGGFAFRPVAQFQRASTTTSAVWVEIRAAACWETSVACWAEPEQGRRGSGGSVAL